MVNTIQSEWMKFMCQINNGKWIKTKREKTENNLQVWITILFSPAYVSLLYSLMATLDMN